MSFTSCRERHHLLSYQSHRLHSINVPFKAFPLPFVYIFNRRCCRGTPDEMLVCLMNHEKLFDIQPHRGTVGVGDDSVTLFQLSYLYTQLGRHVLPILFYVNSRKRDLQHLTAETMASESHFLTFHHTMIHELCPVVIGSMEPLMQYVELLNLSFHRVTIQMHSLERTCVDTKGT